MPARKMNLKFGQVWRAGDLLHALLLVSANDAAVALAEQLGGTDDGFAALMASTVRRLGVDDHPVLRDAAGLDDEFSYQGGNLISARDLAIVTRAALARPELTSIVGEPEYRFGGGDGNPHRLLNHNRLLKTYPGAIGFKTGYTKRAGHCLVAAATRNGRTMIAVVLNAVDTYGSAAALLDRGFATPPAALVDLDHLPEVVGAPAPATADQPVASVPKPAREVPTPVAAVRPAGRPRVPLALAGLLALPAFLLVLRRRQVRLRRQKRRRTVLWAETDAMATSSAHRTEAADRISLR
jgi:D-alanyl-D-alanine carboxypeptidase (penicillin-binding protein 5/6)